MILTTNKMLEFFPADNRFIHFVARKNHMFFRNDDDVESARFFAIEAVMRLVSSEYEFEDEKHLYSVVQKNVLRAIYRMIEWNQAKKNSQDIRPESDFIMSDEDSDTLRSYVQNAPAADTTYDNTMEYIEDAAQQVLDDVGLSIFHLTMGDVARKEISRRLGITPEAVRQRQNSNVKKLKKYYDTHENDAKDLRETREQVRGAIRYTPPTKNKATERSYTEANAFLYTQYEIPYSFSDPE
tara:strand:+ start:775 stop:1494 length:720 start_codon:yes stop_codon:yes gene_type:complete